MTPACRSIVVMEKNSMSKLPDDFMITLVLIDFYISGFTGRDAVSPIL